MPTAIRARPLQAVPAGWTAYRRGGRMIHRNLIVAPRRPRRARVACALLATLALPMAAHADRSWDFSILAQIGSPGGWVQVRENAVQGTRLRIDSDLDVQQMKTLRLRASRVLSDDDALHFGVSASMLDGSTTIAAPVVYNGTTVAPGRLATVTHFQDFLAADAAYWRRFVAFERGGGLWGSVGATYVLLNFRLDGTIAADSAGHELKEDFYVQELPVPTLGLHLDYPFAKAWALRIDATAGRLPWVDSHHSEGGEVRLAQTNEDVSIGVDYALPERWHVGTYLFHSYFAQHERSREDGNAVHLTSDGIGVSAGWRF